MNKINLKGLPGRIYKKRNKRPDGTFVDQTTWTVRYKGKDHSTGETDPEKAEEFLLKLIAATPKRGVSDFAALTLAGLTELVATLRGSVDLAERLHKRIDLVKRVTELEKRVAHLQKQVGAKTGVSE